MNINETSYEVLIVGGGMVGSVLALEISQAGFSVLVIDNDPPEPVTGHISPDLRVTAVNYNSVAQLRRIGAWKYLDERYCAPYRKLETWEWPCSVVTFNANDLNIPALGFVIENRRLRQALWQGFKEYDKLTICCPASLIDIKRKNDGNWLLTLDDTTNVTGQLLVGADGSHSSVCRYAGIAASIWQYRQSCLVLSIEIHDGKQTDITWQKFYPSGPRAFLPLYGHWASLVWYDNTERINQLQKLSPLALFKEVQLAFPDLINNFTIHGSISFSLLHRRIYKYVLPGLVLIGDAAHTINPLAGQGVNLGFRDAAKLSQVLIAARDQEESWKTFTVLKRYQRCRRIDNYLMQVGIDACYATFSNNILPIMVARNIGLMLIQRSDWLKRLAMRYALIGL